ncbi:SDR family oxidoreductase [Shewanella intestini]|uniref:SDR family oxidoreductase n=1 Tax=Shewanella intestini TaxID=2017544 RepID=A0ABS5I0K1_9GAMM|nr:MULTISPECIES: SDR family oxidoreductase [Shewanella]MBR9727214.1 SDR family oxidoreductase [Shewanella intestini]MRG36016.1 SDR family NAD(P)-dependent oxidoreductase [Shewanella sp. XMDDZSB0408]
MKTVIITGANRGIGLALSEYFVAQGANVIAVCRNRSQALSNLGVEIVSGIDVTNESDLKTLQAYVKDIRIDVLICNAGILHDEQFGRLNFDTIRRQFEVNTIAPLQIVELLERQLGQHSKVALITSRMGSITDNTSGGRYGYRMSKAALNAAGMSLSHDLAPRKIAVGIYHPGYVQTDMVGQRGNISARESASCLGELINGLTLAQTGEFRHANGQILPW